MDVRELSEKDGAWLSDLLGLSLGGLGGASLGDIFCGGCKRVIYKGTMGFQLLYSWVVTLSK